jgi:porin
MIRPGLFFLPLLLAASVQAQDSGLSGPSSVAADLVPGDGLTDPQFRSEFPRSVAPGWFDWKDGLAEQGFKFNIDYLALGQWSDADQGAGEAGGGMLRLYGNWQATEHGSLTFKIENRHRYGQVAPQFLGLDGGALSITGTAFNDSDTILTNLFWNQRDPEGRWTFQIGQIDVTDFVDLYGAVSPYTAFPEPRVQHQPDDQRAEPRAGGRCRAGARFELLRCRQPCRCECRSGKSRL